jgi:HTH-type transcriptional regulator/antitoxin HigA
MKKKSTYLEVGVNLEDIVPSKAIHPGEELKWELKERNITQKYFSEISGIQASQLNELIKGKRGLSMDMVFKIGNALKMDPILWARSQMYYEYDLARIKFNIEKKRISKFKKAS